MTDRIRQFSAGEAFALAAVISVLAIAVTYFAVETRRSANEELRASLHAFAVVTGIAHGSSPGRHGWATAYAAWADNNGGGHTISFQADDADHPVAGTAVEIIYHPDALDAARRVADVVKPPRFVAFICGMVWSTAAGLCGYGVYAIRFPRVPIVTRE